MAAADARAGAQVTVARLRELGLTPDTRLGQHFLVDDNLVRVALRLAQLRPDDVVLEVGPGLGVLTAALADAVRLVHAVEIDRRLAPALERSLAGRDNVALLWGDALALDLGSLHPAPTAFVSNLPYQVSTPLIVESLGGLPEVERWAVMVQREAAERLFAREGTPAYGAVSVLMRLACERTGSHGVSRAVFAPPPNVDSTLIGFRRRDDWEAVRGAWPRITAVVHGAFSHRRKTLVNALVLSGVATRAGAEAALGALGVPVGVRAEALPPDRYPALAERL
jgi:16S rRNA (adenine1518-N6/adenine1519-N6)-dimethyltransferase